MHSIVGGRKCVFEVVLIMSIKVLTQLANQKMVNDYTEEILCFRTTIAIYTKELVFPPYI